MADAPLLPSLSQALILQHSGSPRHRGKMEAPDVEAALHNPACGDEISLQLRVREGRIEEARFRGQGCSISQASASMMAALVEGRSLVEADLLAAGFARMMRGDLAAARDPALGDLRALAGVAGFPVRVRCALLPGNAFSEAKATLAGGRPGHPPPPPPGR